VASVKRSLITTSPRASAGSITCTRWSRRAAKAISASVSGSMASCSIRAQLFGQRRAAGLARERDHCGPVAKSLGQCARYAGLARAIDAFKGDEQPCGSWTLSCK
jgi:hypothetical protein